jgi:NlpC/P60 family
MAQLNNAPRVPIRRGFIAGVIIGLGVVGTSLYALSILPRFAMINSTLEQDSLWLAPKPFARLGVPLELAWFFSKFPFLSRSVQILPRNRHLFRIVDSGRHKDYAVSFGQKFRRVEIYDKASPQEVRVRIYMPGTLREVTIKGQRITSDTTQSDGNLWMWARPLWNAEHLKIYGLTDLWLNAAYKKYSCAGFVHQFLADAGIRVPVLDAWDMAKLHWTQIRSDELEPGDIVTIRAATRQHQRFWGHRITHVGVYIGGGKMIHASTSSPRARRSFVKISDLSDFNTRIDKILRPPELL